MRERSKFWAHAVVKGWQEVVTLKDHLEVAAILAAGVLVVGGVSFRLGGQWFAIAIALLILLAIVLDGAYLEYREASRTIERSTDGAARMPSRDYQGLVRALEALRRPESSADVSYASSGELRKAKRLNDIFKAAGWTTDWDDHTPYPLETSHPATLFEGLEVSGYNDAVIDSVADALRQAGYDDVRILRRDLQIQQSNPKYKHAQQRVLMCVGRNVEPPVHKVLSVPRSVPDSIGSPIRVH